MKFVYFRVADDNATAWPLSKLVDVRYNDATNLDLFFRGAIGQDSVDTVTLTITANKHVDVAKAFAQKVNQHPNSDGAIVMYDEENSITFSSKVSAIAIAVATQD